MHRSQAGSRQVDPDVVCIDCESGCSTQSELLSYNAGELKHFRAYAESQCCTASNLYKEVALCTQ